MKPLRSLAWLTVVVGAASPARAAAASPSFVWDAPAECPSRDAVLAEIERAAGGEDVTRTLPTSAKVRFDGKKWRVTLRTEGDGAGERVLHAPSCELAAKATALALALAASSAGEEEEEESEGAPIAETAPAQRATPVHAPPEAAPAAAEPDKTPASGTPSRWSVAGLTNFEWGVLPSAAVGPELRVGYRSLLRLDLGVAYLAGQHLALQERGGATLYRLVTRTRACYPLEVSIFVFDPCATFDLGILGADTSGTATASNAALWAAPGAALDVRVPKSSRVAALVDIGGAAPLNRPQFVLDGVRSIYQPPAFTARLGLGAEARF